MRQQPTGCPPDLRGDVALKFYFVETQISTYVGALHGDEHTAKDRGHTVLTVQCGLDDATVSSRPQKSWTDFPARISEMLRLLHGLLFIGSGFESLGAHPQFCSLTRIDVRVNGG